MAKVKDVLVKYNKIIQFPWTMRKIKKAGKDPAPFFFELGQELAECEDAAQPATKQLLEFLRILNFGI